MINDIFNGRVAYIGKARSIFNTPMTQVRFLSLPLHENKQIDGHWKE